MVVSLFIQAEQENYNQTSSMTETLPDHGIRLLFLPASRLPDDHGNSHTA
jgi:hypothetical protein